MRQVSTSTRTSTPNAHQMPVSRGMPLRPAPPRVMPSQLVARLCTITISPSVATAR